MLYPFRFEPIFQRYLWGGHRLATHWNKPCGPEPAAESWEIVDHSDHQSQVRFGLLKGQTLHQLMQRFEAELVGQSNWNAIHRPSSPPALQGRFPLLFKFLDANQALSIQVHPDDAYAATLNPPDLGKTEAWFVMDAEPGSTIYSGLKAGVTRSDFLQAVNRGTTETLMHSFEPQIGDVVLIPAGTMHALGAGLVIAEIQQASNTTFRVFDWNRVDFQGISRPLHVEQALAVTCFDRGPVKPLRIKDPEMPQTERLVRQGLVQADKFVLTDNRLQSGGQVSLEAIDSFRILVVIDGELAVDEDPAGRPLLKGETVLIPANFQLRISTDQATRFLEITSGAS